MPSQGTRRTACTRRAVPHRAGPGRAVPSHAVPCRAGPRRAVQCRAVPCWPCHVAPCPSAAPGRAGPGPLRVHKGNAYAAARFHSTKFPLSCIVMELATQLEARGLWMDLHWTPRELNTLADQLTNEDFTGFDPKLRVETSFSTLPFVALPSPLETGAALRTEVGCLNARRALAPPSSARRGPKADALRSKEPW